MQKKRNIRSKASVFLGNTFFVLICLIGAGVNIWLFSRNFNQALFKLNETPIATITFKYKTAQRKFIDRVLWDRLRQESPVYNGDTIRTAPQSEATIWFNDGNVMELYQNTMAQVFVNETGSAASLANGDVTINAAGAQSGMSLQSGNSTVLVKAGSEMNAAVTAAANGMPTAIKLQLLQGSASLQQDGSEQNIAAGDLVSVTAAGEVQAQPGIIVTQPGPNVRVLNHNNGTMPVVFSWKTVNMDSGYVMFETSLNHDFSKIEEQISLSSIDTVSVNMQSGTWYWRVYPLTENRTDDTTQNSVTGKLQILPAPPPRMIAPAIDYRFSYRTQLPAVRFIWTGNDWATSYQLTVADNVRMENPVIEQRCSMPSSIVTSLAAGTWYWQVTPYYTVNNTGLAGESAVQSFSILQNGMLKAPRLLLPAHQGFVNTKLDSGVSFSWRNEEEAVAYTLIIADNPALSEPVLNITVNDNYYIAPAHNQQLKNGRYYWAVTQTDQEGNISQRSDVRLFYAVDGEIIHRSVFPPDNYRIAEGRTNDIRFTWKSNLPSGVRVQISADKDFSTTYYDEAQSLTVMQGIHLPVGEWYWRIVADTDDSGTEMNLRTQAKHFSVVPPLAAPKNIKPSHMTRAVIRPATPYTYQWDAVDGADYYQVRLYAAGNSTDILYERNFVEDVELPIEMEALQEGNYRWTVQAFSSETEFATRQTGVLSEATFTMKKLKPVSLNLPKNGITMDGVQAIRNPAYVTWSTIDKPAESTFYLSKNENPEIDPIMKIDNPPETFRLDRLRDGTYYWTIKAMTADDLDISAIACNSFSVTPIEPLPATVLTAPADDTVFDAAYLRQSRSVVFSWNPVAGASDYFFRIKDRSRKVVLEQRIQSGTSYELSDLAVLDRGKFTWEVEAVSRIDDDVILQRGINADAQFKIDLPKIKHPVFNDTGALYGK